MHRRLSILYADTYHHTDQNTPKDDNHDTSHLCNNEYINRIPSRSRLPGEQVKVSNNYTPYTTLPSNLPIISWLLSQFFHTPTSAKSKKISKNFLLVVTHVQNTSRALKWNDTSDISMFKSIFLCNWRLIDFDLNCGCSCSSSIVLQRFWEFISRHHSNLL